jgi:hypothetical protein
MTATVTADKFDAIMSPRPASGDRLLWTARTIAKRLGTSADFVADVLAKEPNSPVKIVGGRYVAVEAELIDWFRPDQSK